VRGHSFRGMRVKSFSEIKSTYTDLVIVLSSASNRSEVIEMLAEMDRGYEMYVPDMPIAGTDEYFDRDFYNSNYNEILFAYDTLEDEMSKNIFAAVINYRLSGKMSYLLDAGNTKDEIYSLFDSDCIRVMVDAGAYNGDTAKEGIEYFKKLEKIYAVEPDRRNFKKLLRFCEGAQCDVIPINAALYSTCTSGSFMGSANRNSTAVATPSHEHRDESVELISLDSLLLPAADYLKYDVEGAEYEALVGSKQTILSYRPYILISLYHRSRDIFYLVNYMRKEYPEYKFYLRRPLCIPAWELNLIMIPKN